MTTRPLISTEIEQAYRRRTPASAAFVERAKRSLPGGNTRTTVFHPPYPLTFARGQGPWIWDLDGNRYADLFYNGLSLIHGHAYAPIGQAVSAAIGDGMALGSPSPELLQLAELLQGRIAAAERVRFTNSGSEAGMIAARVARAFTGRPLLVKAEHAYHGSYPDLEAGLYGVHDMPGRTLVGRFNDLESFERIVAAHGDQIAAIVLEPVMFTGRVVTPEPGFLQGVQALARRNGSLFILDDCLMFRLAEGGSAGVFGLEPDLVMLGKFLGGGTPMGAVAGREAVMSILDPRTPGFVFHGGSFNGNRIGAIAGYTALRDLTAEAIAGMDQRMSRLRQSLVAAAEVAGVAVEVTGTGSIGGIAFLDDHSRHEDDPNALGISMLFQLACLNEGVSIGPGGLMALATAVDDEALAHIAGGMGRALQTLAGAIG
ncbi:MAG: aminotransferase class III-fold pyridoxal phosphate-dependent enzyme [Caulobacteraceae bacterium]